MLILVGTVRMPPENLETARPVMARMVEASRAEDGCIAYSYAQDVFDPSLIRINEAWRDLAALEAHFQMPHIKEWRAAWPGLGIGERQITRYEVASAQET
ncbi:MAG: antibiotic biosynthesis monooxygenase [Sphingobium sp.]|nr:antibiotic biosynthesis monooxygenase [Sphingobium sp.]